MTFEWDEAKAAGNLAKHGVSFDEAKTVFDDPLYVDFYDPDHSADEPPISLSESRAKVVCCLFLNTERDNAIRLISARQLTQTERRAYEEN